MLAFYFKISIRKNTIKYFTIFDDFPFLLEDPKNQTLRLRLQKCFERLVTEQERNKNTPLSDKRLDLLIIDLNRYMKATGSVWRMVNEDPEYKEFQLRKLNDKAEEPPLIYYKKPIHMIQSANSPIFFDRRQPILNQSNYQTQSVQMPEMNPHKILRCCKRPSSDSASKSSAHIFRPWL